VDLSVNISRALSQIPQESHALPVSAINGGLAIGRRLAPQVCCGVCVAVGVCVWGMGVGGWIFGAMDGKGFVWVWVVGFLGSGCVNGVGEIGVVQS
jgi:hypothetical protein